MVFSKNTLYFSLMNTHYFNDFESLDEFQKDNNRGHGVMIIDINDLLIAIPLRSSLPPYMNKSNHLFPYEIYTKKSDGKEYLKALDFSKLTIVKEEHVNTKTTYFFKDSKEKKFYLDNFSRIQLRVKNYIKSYQNICLKIGEQKKLTKHTLKPYRFSTLRNFHEELGISITKDDFIKIHCTFH